MGSIMTSKTETNLRLAFAAETLAGRRYLAFAERAEREGLLEAAALFRAAAAARAGQARGLMEQLQAANTLPGGPSRYDLRSATMHEVHESSDLYPSMIRNARNAR